MKKASIVQLVFLDQTGDTLYRMKWPSEALSEACPDWTIINLDVMDERRFSWGLDADLLVIFQSQDLDLLPLIEARRKRNLRTLVEYNDNFYDPPVASPVYEAWTSPKVWSDYEAIMRAADGIIVTCESLEKLFSLKIKKPITILKNNLPDKNLPAFDQKIAKWDQAKLNLCWGGSMGHFPDLLASYPFIRELISENPNLQLSLMGNDMIPSHIDLPKSRFYFRNWGSMDDYYKFLDEQHIGFIPLLDTPYNQCRSDIKAVEMISRGVIPVIPAASPYNELIQKTGLPTYKNFQEMKAIIKSFYDDPQRSIDLLKVAYHYISESRLRSAVDTRRKLYESFIQDTRDFPIPAGYYEYKSSTFFSPLTQNFEKVQRLTKVGYHQKAIDVLDNEIKQNAEISDYKILRLQVLKNADNKKWMEEVRMLDANQTEDYRLKAMQLEVLKDGELKSYLEKLFLDIQKSPENSRKHIIQAIGQNLVQVLKNNIELLPQIEKFVPLFSRYIPLRLEVAKTLQATNRKAEALTEYEKILEISETIEWSKEYILSLSPAYFRSLVQSARS